MRFSLLFVVLFFGVMASAGAGPTRMLHVTAETGGSVFSIPSGIYCKSNARACRKKFPMGTRVGLIVAPWGGYEFIGWVGACKGVGKSCSRVIDKPTRVKAKFRKIKATRSDTKISDIAAVDAAGRTLGSVIGAEDKSVESATGSFNVFTKKGYDTKYDRIGGPPKAVVGALYFDDFNCSGRNASWSILPGQVGTYMEQSYGSPAEAFVYYSPHDGAPLESFHIASQQADGECRNYDIPVQPRQTVYEVFPNDALVTGVMDFVEGPIRIKRK